MTILSISKSLRKQLPAFCEPGERIHSLSPLAQLKIERAIAGEPRVAGFTDHIPSRNLLTDLDQQFGRVRIQGEKSVGMIQDDDLSISFQPVREYDDTRHHGSNRAPFIRSNFDALSLNIGVERRMFLPPEKGDDFSVSGPVQSTFERVSSFQIFRELQCGAFAPRFQFL